MPRNSLDIKEFKYGIISAVDEEDIAQESASDSLNVDGDVGEGILRGIPTDSEYKIDSDGDAAADDSIADIRLGEFIENGGLYDLIYHDSNANKLIGVKNFYGALPIKQDLATTNISDNTSIVLDKKSVHVGTGYGSANVPRWLGYISHYQFGLVAADYRDSYSGSVGGNDLTANTTGYTGLKKRTYYVTIDNDGATPETFAWGIDGVEVANSVNITGSPQDLYDGTYTISITFGATTGHANGDLWYIDTAGIYVVNAVCTAPTTNLDLTATEHTGTGFFASGTIHNWKVSYIYDGVQESLLTSTDTIDTVGASDADYYTLKLNANSVVSNPNSFNRRITGINIYRADSNDGIYANIGLFRLVASLDINDSNWATGTGGEIYDRIITIYDYGTYYSYSAGGTVIPSNPVTYNENTGISETLSSQIVNYSLSTAGNSYLFVGRCYKSELPDAERYIFRSKSFRYDIFDWTTDFLVMPEAITALHFHDGKLFAFSLNKTYRINPDGLYIEDTFDDAGCQGQRAVHSNEYGMFFGNISNAWMYKQGTFYPIGDAIRQSDIGKSWTKTFNFIIDTSPTLADLIVTSDAKKGYVLFINERDVSGDKYFAWAYHPQKKRWDAFAFGGYATSANGGAFKGKDGEVYLSNAAATYKLMRPSASYPANTQAWEWYSQELTFGETRQVKSLTMIKIDATGTVSITYGVDGATPATSGTTDTLINVYNKSIKIKLNAAATSTATAYTNYVDSMEILFRPLVGKR